MRILTETTLVSVTLDSKVISVKMLTSAQQVVKMPNVMKMLNVRTRKAVSNVTVIQATSVAVDFV